ncbi:hypothetical protein ROHU_032100 [Labeo rohita]|uniref:Uncharacterized protein n=1 Tax=Labeo rohita TaxID=84645 RepID=A0A498LI72_LABRO|nr:hypothetical protein ROHU_032100 [Labeo rohita]
MKKIRRRRLNETLIGRQDSSPSTAGQKHVSLADVANDKRSHGGTQTKTAAAEVGESPLVLSCGVQRRYLQKKAALSHSCPPRYRRNASRNNCTMPSATQTPGSCYLLQKNTKTKPFTSADGNRTILPSSDPRPPKSEAPEERLIFRKLSAAHKHPYNTIEILTANNGARPKPRLTPTESRSGEPQAI